MSEETSKIYIREPAQLAISSEKMGPYGALEEAGIAADGTIVLPPSPGDKSRFVPGGLVQRDSGLLLSKRANDLVEGVSTSGEELAKPTLTAEERALIHAPGLRTDSPISKSGIRNQIAQVDIRRAIREFRRERNNIGGLPNRGVCQTEERLLKPSGEPFTLVANEILTDRYGKPTQTVVADVGRSFYKVHGAEESSRAVVLCNPQDPEKPPISLGVTYRIPMQKLKEKNRAAYNDLRYSDKPFGQAMADAGIKYSTRYINLFEIKALDSFAEHNQNRFKGHEPDSPEALGFVRYMLEQAWRNEQRLVKEGQIDEPRFEIPEGLMFGEEPILYGRVKALESPEYGRLGLVIEIPLTRLSHLSSDPDVASSLEKSTQANVIVPPRLNMTSVGPNSVLHVRGKSLRA